ncbi:MAG: histidine phosphatase family protein [Acidimicrobiales bacterium]
MSASLPLAVLLVRHGATEWSSNGRHTGRTDLPLTPEGHEQAAALQPLLARLISERTLVGTTPPVVFTSTLERARDTAAGALPGVEPEPTHLLLEVDYGRYEGMRIDEIRAHDPTWNVFTSGCPEGENVHQVAARCESFIAKIERVAAGRVVVAFTHGHFSRFLTARMLGLHAASGEAFWNDTGSVAVIDQRRGSLVLTGWNVRPM